MLLMGLEPEYQRALTHVKSLDPRDTNTLIPFFETTIRYIGGLLGAYTMSLDPVFLRKADELGQMLLPAFESETGLPHYFVNPKTQETKPGAKGRQAMLSEVASFQLEFNTLAKFTGRKEYARACSKVNQFMESSQSNNSLWYTAWDIHTSEPLKTHYAVGGNADSAYEYLLKQYLNDPTLRPSREMYINAANGIIYNLLYISPNRHLLYATDIPSSLPTGKLEHLTCFLPGLLALGVHTLHEHLSLRERRTHMYAAEGLAQTCWLLYADAVTGLGPDEVVFSRWPAPKSTGKDPVEKKAEEVRQGRWIEALGEWEKGAARWRKGGVWGSHEQADKVPPGVRDVHPVPGDTSKRDYWLRRPENLLRPEVVESLYILWKTTGDKKWRERGWQICEAYNNHARTPVAYSGIRRVDTLLVRWTDSMPSWFLAETLKYCYLIASDDDLLPFDRYVLTTQAHVLPRFSWDGWRKKFRIKNIA